MPLTRYKTNITILTEDVANSWFGGLFGTADGATLSSTDPLVAGHIHDGQHLDGHSQKVDLDAHTTGQLDGANILDASVSLAKLSFVPGGGDLAATLILGNITGATNIEVSDGTTIKGEDALLASGNNGFPLILIGGSGDGAGGVGAIQTLVTGNARGLGAIDLQQISSSVTNVASGNYSCIPGGRNNRASGSSSFASGGGSIATGASSAAMCQSLSSGVASFSSGYSNATGDYSISSGYYSYANGNYSFSHGIANSGTRCYADGIGSVAFATEGGAYGNYSFAHGYSSVATGTGSVVMGFNGSAVGDRSMAINSNGSSTGINSLSLGLSCSTSAAGAQAMAGGNNTSANGANSISFGISSITTGDNSISIGNTTQAYGSESQSFGSNTSTTAIGTNSMAGGRQSIASVPGQISWSSGRTTNPSQGAAQWAIYHLNAQTSNTAITPLRALAASLIIRANKAYGFKGIVSAYDAAGVVASAWEVSGLIKRDGASNTTLVGVTITLINQDLGAATWAVAISADDATESLEVNVSGAAATTISWDCMLNVSESGT